MDEIILNAQYDYNHVYCEDTYFDPELNQQDVVCEPTPINLGSHTLDHGAGEEIERRHPCAPGRANNRDLIGQVSLRVRACVRACLCRQAYGTWGWTGAGYGKLGPRAVRAWRFIEDWTAVNVPVIRKSLRLVSNQIYGAVHINGKFKAEERSSIFTWPEVCDGGG